MTGQDFDRNLSDWKAQALDLEDSIKQVIVGQDRILRLLLIGVFARGNILLEGDVGVGKTTILRALARGIGGAYERIEGTIDMMPSDLIYHTYIGEDGRPRVEPGPVLKHGEGLATFFFNEVNRARPQVHSLLLRVMAEHSVTAFNQEHEFPHLQVFADRNRVEKEETFELPAAARDRFLMEILVEQPADEGIQEELMFNPRFHDVDRLVEGVDEGIVPYDALNGIATALQEGITASPTLRHYALELWRALRRPQDYGVNIEGVDMARLVSGGGSPRGMAMLARVARVHAWLEGRDAVVPEDVQGAFYETAAHRIFFTPVYELRRDEIAPALVEGIFDAVKAP